MKLNSLPFDLNLAEPLLTLERDKRLTFVNLANSAAKSYLIAELQHQTGFKNIFWASTDEKADELTAAAELFFDGNIIEISADITPAQLYQIQDYLRSDTPTLVLFEDFEGLDNHVFPKQSITASESLTITSGETVRIFDIFAQLESMGYSAAKETILQPGEFLRQGDALFVYPTNQAHCYRIDLFGDEVESISAWDQVKKCVRSQKLANAKVSKCESEGIMENQKSVVKNTQTTSHLAPRTSNLETLTLLPHTFSDKSAVKFFEAVLPENDTAKNLFIADDLDSDIIDSWKMVQSKSEKLREKREEKKTTTDNRKSTIDNIENTSNLASRTSNAFHLIKFTSFPQETETFYHLNFFSVLPYYTVHDFIHDIKERMRREYEIVLVTKKHDEIMGLFQDNNVMSTKNLNDKTPSTIKVVQLEDHEFIPHSFQNNERKILLLTDREIFAFNRNSRQRKAVSGVNMQLMNSLKAGDHVVHSDHGLAEFDGIVRRDLGKNFGVREYLKLCYANNDKLFVPVESAEKITKFIGDDVPKLTRLGSSDWVKKQEKLKKEAEKIAKELLKLYAAREMAKGNKFSEDDDAMNDFCQSFPYELTPGQAHAWADVKRDLEKAKPMDRLVCGDVGFGKTEIAMRAAFKTFCSGYQAVILAPITILAEQHYQSFMKRIAGKDYGVRVELMSRFQSKAEQNKILKDLKHGLVDIVIGTHRLLSDDVEFKKLGLVVIDEEQRFGVKQKERMKKIRAGVDTLTMTATPIPRTLNMSLNKLKDISTITPPPPGRLPVVTEVRKYNLNLVRERILFELERGGQIYFLHNQVKTIDGLMEQLQVLIPEARFIVAHGQLKPEELETRIRRFKEGEADVLIASTIIENGIDLANANTLFVNRAEKFGLSQLYQLRGRVGRGRTQAYAYFLYHGQKLELDAKKRLRAIVEASELGSGFQIAMRDLEIRGAGEVLGAGQSGAMKGMGVAHFIRMLNKTVEEMKRGETSSEIEEEENITVEIPLSAYIPAGYIPNVNEKISVYQELASAEDEEHLQQIRKELRQDYGHLPTEVENLCKVISLKLLLRAVHLEGVKINKNSHRDYEIVLRMGKKFTPDQLFGIIKESKNKWTITAKALKLKLETLSITWYEELRAEIELLKGEK